MSEHSSTINTLNLPDTSMIDCYEDQPRPLIFQLKQVEVDFNDIEKFKDLVNDYKKEFQTLKNEKKAIFFAVRDIKNISTEMSFDLNRLLFRRYSQKVSDINDQFTQLDSKISNILDEHETSQSERCFKSGLQYLIRKFESKSIHYTSLSVKQDIQQINEGIESYKWNLENIQQEFQAMKNNFIFCRQIYEQYMQSLRQKEARKQMAQKKTKTKSNLSVRKEQKLKPLSKAAKNHKNEGRKDLRSPAVQGLSKIRSKPNKNIKKDEAQKTKKDVNPSLYSRMRLGRCQENGIGMRFLQVENRLYKDQKPKRLFRSC